MKQFIDFLPIIAFFIAYKAFDPYVAAGTLLVASVIVYGGLWWVQKKLEKMQWITLIGSVVFSALALLFHSETFLKWKAPIVSWILACIFLATGSFSQKPLVRHMLDHVAELSDQNWNRLNLGWAGFLFFSGLANLIVAYTFHDYWVDFKLFGTLAMTFLFIFGMMYFIHKNGKLIEPSEDQSKHPPKE